MTKNRLYLLGAPNVESAVSLAALFALKGETVVRLDSGVGRARDGGGKKGSAKRAGRPYFPRARVIFGKFRDVDVPRFKEVVCRGTRYIYGGYPIKMQRGARAT